MPKSLHLIHLGRKARGDKAKRPATLAEARRRIKLPFKPEHVMVEELKEAIRKLP